MPIAARPLLLAYAKSLEEQLASQLQQSSLGYWLHLYRRLGPSPIGDQRDAKTVYLTRASMEAAIQKYAMFNHCDKFGSSEDIGINNILGGLIASDEFALERKLIQENPQFVLGNFSVTDLKHFYEIEHLAYEVWRTSAQLRSNGKGAHLDVRDDQEPALDIRSPDLDVLLQRFDERNSYGFHLGLSATGTVYTKTAPEGNVLFPIYNVGGVVLDQQFDRLLALYGITLSHPVQPNFLWLPTDIRGFYAAHRPLESAFEERHGTSLLSVLAVITALGYRVQHIWHETKGQRFFNYWMRGYEGPFPEDFIRNEVTIFSHQARHIIGVSEAEWRSVDLTKGIHFWTLTNAQRSVIDLVYAGPHAMFLPFGNRFFIDYAWVHRRLFELFAGVTISDQNFKGTALENAVTMGNSELPTGPCINKAGQRKQIDAAFRKGDCLIIVECRAVSRSIAFERGDPQAIRRRNQTIDKALSDIDSKAEWLAANPRGRNYDITWAQRIVPIAVTPFIQFISSLNTRYWITEELPRVMTPEELRQLLESDALLGVQANTVSISVS